MYGMKHSGIKARFKYIVIILLSFCCKNNGLPNRKKADPYIIEGLIYQLFSLKVVNTIVKIL